MLEFWFSFPCQMPREQGRFRLLNDPRAGKVWQDQLLDCAKGMKFRDSCWSCCCGTFSLGFLGIPYFLSTGTSQSKWVCDATILRAKLRLFFAAQALSARLLICPYSSAMFKNSSNETLPSWGKQTVHLWTRYSCGLAGINVLVQPPSHF